jgi:hypothetical protein
MLVVFVLVTVVPTFALPQDHRVMPALAHDYYVKKQ